MAKSEASPAVHVCGDTCDVCDNLHWKLDREREYSSTLLAKLRVADREVNRQYKNYLTVADAIAADSESPEQLAKIARDTKAERDRLAADLKAAIASRTECNDAYRAEAARYKAALRQIANDEHGSFAASPTRWPVNIARAALNPDEKETP